MLASAPYINYSMNVSSNSGEINGQKPSSRLSTLCAQIRQRFSPLVNSPGVHTVVRLTAMGFRYTGNGDTARCDRCALEVSNWTFDMDPWNVHSTQSPRCPFVCSLKPHPLSIELSSPSRLVIAKRKRPTELADVNPLARQKTELTDLESPLNTSVEADSFRKAKRRTFSDWPHRSTPSSDQMIDAGFFACNIYDRVICIYCNIVCQQWTPHVDEPCEVHRTISPKCQYVREKLLSREPPHLVNPDKSSSRPQATTAMRAQRNINSLEFSTLLRPPARTDGNENVSRPSASTSTMSIAEKIRTDFFYSPIKHDENCADCKKFLSNMGFCDSQTADFARWFVHCVHTKQYTANQVHHQIKTSEQAQLRRIKNNASSDRLSDTNPTTDSQQSAILDGSTLPRFIAGQSGLEIPQQLLGRNFSLSILRRIWGNQLCFDHDDSDADADLLMACIILQKQIQCIDGKIENVFKPSVKVTEIQEQLKNFAKARSEHALTNTNVQMAQSNDSTPYNPCALCSIEEKRLACIPCGHLATCVSCGDGLRACPICQRTIDAFVRIYV